MAAVGQAVPSGQPASAGQETDRNAVIARIRMALKRRSGKAWSVTGGTGTAWGWIHLDAPPARRTWRERTIWNLERPDYPAYEEYDSGMPGGHTSPAERMELGALLGFDKPVHFQGHNIAASTEYRREYLDRAEGREPRAIAQPYWD